MQIPVYVVMSMPVMALGLVLGLMSTVAPSDDLARLLTVGASLCLLGPVVLWAMAAFALWANQQPVYRTCYWCHASKPEDDGVMGLGDRWACFDCCTTNIRAGATDRPTPDRPTPE